MTSNTRLTNKLHKFTDNLALLSHVSTERTKLYVKYFPLCFFHWPRKDIFSTSFSPFLFFQSLLSRCYSLCCRKIYSLSHAFLSRFSYSHIFASFQLSVFLLSRDVMLFSLLFWIFWEFSGFYLGRDNRLQTLTTTWRVMQRLDMTSTWI